MMIKGRRAYEEAKSIGMMILLVLVAIGTIACSSGKEEAVIEEFLTCWLQNSTANAEAFDQLFEETYGKYMTDEALETFKAEQYSVCSMLFPEGSSWEISKIDIQEESEWKMESSMGSGNMWEGKQRNNKYRRENNSRKQR